MKVYLDDVRDTPTGYVRCYWPSEVIELLKSREVTHLSLDHDLGDDVVRHGTGGTGYDVLSWLEETVFYDHTFPLPEITIHSANSSAVLRMRAAVDQIQRLAGSR